MVVRITTGKSLRRALSYNEKKLASGNAQLLKACGFPMEDNLLGFSAKLKRFQTLIDRNPGVDTNAVHISLNFPPEEKLTEEKMQNIALDYMERIGFGDQPFLVYRHTDAKHPHIHIVSTNLRQKGRPINLHNLVVRASEPARKAIELNFALIQAQSRPRQKVFNSQMLPWPALYGKEETKHAITNIVGSVLFAYKFASLEELNAILGQYRVMAYPGAPTSRMHKAGGLVYSLLDKDGGRVGVPIKASSIYGKPTLKNLHKRFAAGGVKKMGSLVAIRKTVERCLNPSDKRISPKTALEKLDIGWIVERSEVGTLQSAHFVDHRRKAVFSAEELGIGLEDLVKALDRPAVEEQKASADLSGDKAPSFATPIEQVAVPASTLAIMQALFASESDWSGPSDETDLKKKKKRKGPML